MESLETRYSATKKCLASLHESLTTIENPKFKEIYKQLRDSVIQRFEYTIDTFWKFLRAYLEEKHGASFSLVSPKEVLRTALQAQILTQQEFNFFIDMVQDRNQTSHTYNELLAESIKKHIFNYYHIVKNVMDRLSI